jgi:hypothetical protein
MTDLPPQASGTCRQLLRLRAVTAGVWGLSGPIGARLLPPARNATDPKGLLP